MVIYSSPAFFKPKRGRSTPKADGSTLAQRDCCHATVRLDDRPACRHPDKEVFCSHGKKDPSSPGGWRAAVSRCFGSGPRERAFPTTCGLVSRGAALRFDAETEQDFQSLKKQQFDEQYKATWR